MIIKRIKYYSNIEPRSGYPKDQQGNELPRPGWNINNPKKLKIKYNIVFKDSYKKDRERVFLKNDKDRINKLVDSLRRGNIFDNDPYDDTEYTHFLRLKNGLYFYSKDIYGRDRLVYSVSKPKEVYDESEGENIIRISIFILSCREHKFGNKRQDLFSDI